MAYIFVRYARAVVVHGEAELRHFAERGAGNIPPGDASTAPNGSAKPEHLFDLCECRVV